MQETGGEARNEKTKANDPETESEQEPLVGGDSDVKKTQEELIESAEKLARAVLEDKVKYAQRLAFAFLRDIGKPFAMRRNASGIQRPQSNQVN